MSTKETNEHKLYPGAELAIGSVLLTMAVSAAAKQEKLAAEYNARQDPNYVPPPLTVQQIANAKLHADMARAANSIKKFTKWFFIWMFIILLSIMSVQTMNIPLMLIIAVFMTAWLAHFLISKHFNNQP